MLTLLLQRLFRLLFIVFCVAYPFALVGIAFNVRSSFSLDWAGSVFLFLEGSVLLLTAMLTCGWQRGLLAGLFIIVLSYCAEAVGVGTGFPFGAYRYTHILFPALPGNVPAPVMFAWILIVLGAYGSLRLARSYKAPTGFGSAVVGALLATLLDLEIEPVAFHIEHYWEWLAPGRVNYYGVPLVNFVAWFVVALLLLLGVDILLRRVATPSNNLPLVAPCVLFVTSLFMFGFIDLTHGYYGAIVPGCLAGILLWIVWRGRPVSKRVKPR